MTLLLERVKAKSNKKNIPTGKVKNIKFKGVRNKLLKPKSPIACFFAKSNREVKPVMPKLWTEKYRLRKVGIEPTKIPVQKKYLHTLLCLSKWYKRKGDSPKRGTKAI